MPKIKIEKVISFSSEDPVYPANNILSSDPSRKWKCQTAGETCASLVLQLEEASVISSIDIGNEHSAYVEVLVNRSGSNDDFKVLLVMSSFMSPLDSRQSMNVNKVRMFTYDQLAEQERDEKWDRVKIVCTQPFNRHVNYGLSFITFNTLNKSESNSQPQHIGKFTLRPDSPNNLIAGSIFARKKEIEEYKPLTAAAAIRKASQSPQSTSKKFNLPQTATTSKDLEVPSLPRNRDEIMYSKDEEESKPETKEKLDTKQNGESNRQKKQEIEKLETKQTSEKDINKKASNDDFKINNKKETKTSTSKDRGESSKRKLKIEHKPSKKPKKQSSKPFFELLQGVVIAISGIQNPERANMRAMAMSMGAKYKADWDNTCTHLICAFPNTPKFNQVKGKGKIVTKAWIADCHAKRKRLPWRRYALDRNDQGKDESEEEICEEIAKAKEESDDENRDAKSGSDTEDEIERVAQQKNTNDCDTEDEIERLTARNAKVGKVENNGRSPIAASSSQIDHMYDLDTDEEIVTSTSNNDCAILPNFFENLVFYIDENLGENQKKMLTKYIFACNGTIATSLKDELQYIITSTEHKLQLSEISSKPVMVNPDFVYECFNSGKLIPDADFII